MFEHTSIRGTRVGIVKVSRLGELPEPQRLVSYWCDHGHYTRLVLAVSAAVVEQWSCRCGLAAGQDQTRPPEPVIERPFKTHFGYVRDRRTDAEGEALLAEALARLRARGGSRPAGLGGLPPGAPS